MTVDDLLDRLFAIKKNVNFAKNRNDARRVYKLLEENKLELKYEQNIFTENVFKIERSLLVEENRETACKTFIIALNKIINIIEYNYRGKNYKTT